MRALSLVVEAAATKSVVPGGRQRELLVEEAGVAQRLHARHQRRRRAQAALVRKRRASPTLGTPPAGGLGGVGGGAGGATVFQAHSQARQPHRGPPCRPAISQTFVVAGRPSVFAAPEQVRLAVAVEVAHRQQLGLGGDGDGGDARHARAVHGPQPQGAVAVRAPQQVGPAVAAEVREARQAPVGGGHRGQRGAGVGGVGDQAGPRRAGRALAPDQVGPLVPVEIAGSQHAPAQLGSRWSAGAA